MRIHLLLFTVLLTTTLTFAQAKPPAQPGEQKRDPARTEPGGAGQKDMAVEAAKTELSPNAPVITIKGVCPASPPATQKPAADCRTIVTRAEFEKLMNALNPDMSPDMRERFAETYGRLLVIGAEARKAGVEKAPGADLLYEFAKLQVLAQQLGKKLQDEASNIPEAEFETYYREHQKEYDEVELQRVIVPRSRSNDKQKPAPSEAEEKAFAEKIRARWVAGEDPTKLQQEAYKQESLDTPAPPVDLGDRRRNTLPMTQQSIFDLKAGDVSPVFVDPAAFFIYKVQKRETKPLASVKDEIKKTLTGERLQKSMERVTSSAEAVLNPAYFASTAPPAVNAERDKKPVPNPARVTPRKPATPEGTKPATTPTTKPETPVEPNTTAVPK